jgi:putative FmdB family regulatory protein
MPTYEYCCPACGTFDVFQSMKDNPLKVCPTCRSRKIKRQISSGAGIIFKGSGFYQTDYRSSGYHSDVKADTAAKSASSAAPKADTAAKAPGSPAPKTDSAPAKTGTGKTPTDK